MLFKNAARAKTRSATINRGTSAGEKVKVSFTATLDAGVCKDLDIIGIKDVLGLRGGSVSLRAAAKGVSVDFYEAATKISSQEPLCSLEFADVKNFGVNFQEKSTAAATVSFTIEADGSQGSRLEEFCRDHPDFDGAVKAQSSGGSLFGDIEDDGEEI